MGVAGLGGVDGLVRPGRDPGGVPRCCMRDAGAKRAMAYNSQNVNQVLGFIQLVLRNPCILRSRCDPA